MIIKVATFKRQLKVCGEHMFKDEDEDNENKLTFINRLLVYFLIDLIQYL